MARQTLCAAGLCQIDKAVGDDLCRIWGAFSAAIEVVPFVAGCALIVLVCHTIRVRDRSTNRGSHEPPARLVFKEHFLGENLLGLL